MSTYHFKSARKLTALVSTLAAFSFLSAEQVLAEESTDINDQGVSLDQAQSQVASHEELTAASAQESTVTIAHTNDIHGRMKEDRDVIGLAKAAEFYDQIDADLVLDAGDAYQGLPLSNHDEGETLNEAMTAAGYQALAVGNHEFDFGQDVALKYGSHSVEGADPQQMPALSTNTYYSDDQDLMFQPSKTVTTEHGYHIAIIGVTTPETKTKTHPQNVENVDFTEPIPAVIAEIDRLIEDQTIAEDAFVILAHLGIDPATPEGWRGSTLAQRLDAETKYDAYQIIVIDGHSHTVAPAQSFGNVIYQQTGTALNNIGVITFDPNQPGSAQGRLYDKAQVDAIIDDQRNEAIADLIDQAASTYEKETGRVIVANNPVWLNGVREYVRSQETNLGNLITDAMVAYGRDGGFNNPTSFAMINGGGIREPIAKDQPITEGDVIAVLPFGNIISQITVTGEQIYDMFEHAYSAPVAEEAYTSSDGNYTVPAIDPDTGLPNLTANGGFLQVSSDVKVYYDPTAEAGQRVLGVYLYNPESQVFDYVENDDSTEYYMATNDFLAQGGDGYDMLSGAREEGPSLDQVVMQAIEHGGQAHLAQYEDPFPSERIFAITTADYQDQFVQAGPAGTPEELGFTVDQAQPVETKKSLDVVQVGRYHSSAPFDEAGTEIAVYNPATDYIYSVNGYEKSVDIIDTHGLVTDQFELIKRVRLADLGIEAGDVTSVNLHPSRKFIAVAAQALEKTDPGHVIFLDAYGNFLSTVRTGQAGTTQGALPDDTAFAHDGTKLLLAIEGEPNEAYTINPAGGITVVDIPASLDQVKEISQDNVRFIALTADHLPDEAHARVVGDTAEEQALNMEPEFIAIDANDTYAYVSIQEYNAIGRFNIEDEVFEDVGFLGYKDHSLAGNELDPSDRDDLLQPRRQPVLGLHMPDAIDLFEANGKTYILIPGEGDAMDYDGFSEETRIKDLAEDGLIQLNADYYQGFSQEELDDLVANGLFDDDQLGRLRVTTAHPFVNAEGKHEALVSYGSRSFAIVDVETLEIVYDSGADFENIVLARHPEIFNVDVEARDEFGLDKRSDNKGAEPETVVYGEVNGVPYAFIALERTLGFMIYDLSDINNPVFVDFFYDQDYVDISPEGLQFIPAEDSPTGQALLLAAYEQSGTIGVYQLNSLVEETTGQQTAGKVTTPTKQDPAITPASTASKDATAKASDSDSQSASTTEEALPQTGAGSIGLIAASTILSGLGLAMVGPSKKEEN